MVTRLRFPGVCCVSMLVGLALLPCSGAMGQVVQPANEIPPYAGQPLGYPARGGPWPARAVLAPPPWTPPPEAGTYFDQPYVGYPGDTRIYRSWILGRLWAEGEYLAWATKNSYLPPLLSVNGVTTVGDTGVHGDLRSGGRIRGGYWWTPEHISGIELSYFELDDCDLDFAASGAAGGLIGRPYVDANTNLPASLLISDNVNQVGSTIVLSDTDLLGAEALWRHELWFRPGFRLDGVAGYRYGRLFDQLFVQDDIYTPVASPDTEIIRSDLLRSVNEFHGGELGLIARWWGFRWALQSVGKVAVGSTRNVATIDGSTQTIDLSGFFPVVVDTVAGGLLAQPSNIGQYSLTETSAMAELGVSIEFAITRQLRATLGYTYIYWSDVARVLDSVDLRIDPDQIPPNVDPTATSPTFVQRSDSFWAQGLNVGFSYDF